MQNTTQKKCVICRSKHNNKRKRMIGDGEKYHYLAVTNLSTLLKRVSSNHKEDFYFLN